MLGLDNSMTLTEYNAYELFYQYDGFVEYLDVLNIIKSFTLDDMNHFIKKIIGVDPIITIVEPK